MNRFEKLLDSIADALELKDYDLALNLICQLEDAIYDAEQESSNAL